MKCSATGETNATQPTDITGVAIAAPRIIKPLRIKNVGRLGDRQTDRRTERYEKPEIQANDARLDISSLISNVISQP